MASRARRKTEYRRWNAEEEELLYELSEKGLPDAEIAVLLDRSIIAIWNRRYYLREKGNWERLSKIYDEQEKKK
ncbi:hypothetical protein [Lactococcus taiwanensis]|uniref:hypothetical protein n=1 Tax=Lactococcus taiwanensis TaxID=1151742 RepID=UPI0035193650